MSGNCTDHKVEHNITTLANIPLVIWLIVSVLTLAGSTYDEFAIWISHPVNIVAAILFVYTTLRHFTLEIEVVFEDYIANICLRKSIIMAMKLFFILLGLTSIISVLKIGL